MEVMVRQNKYHSPGSRKKGGTGFDRPWSISFRRFVLISIIYALQIFPTPNGWAGLNGTDEGKAVIGQSLNPPAFTHIGSTDPTSEGFETIFCGGMSSTAPVADDYGHAAWTISGSAQDSQYGYYSGALSAAQKADIAGQGFVLTLSARAEQGVAPTYYVPNKIVALATTGIDTGSQRFEVALGLDSAGDTVVILPTTHEYGPGNSILSSGPIFTLTGSGSSYHIYQLVFNPNTQSADLYVDGIKRIQDYVGHTFSVYDLGVMLHALSGGKGFFDYVNLTIGAQNFPAPTLTEISRSSAAQGDRFNVVFTGSGLSTVNAVISDNPGLSGSIVARSDTAVTAVITIDPQAETGETTLGLSTLGGTVNLPFNVVTPTYTCAQRPGGLVSWWKGNGNPIDQIGQNNGTLNGGVGFADGKVGEAFSFNGIDGYVDIGQLGQLQNATEMTVSAWVRKNSSGKVAGYVGKWDSSGPGHIGNNTFLLYQGEQSVINRDCFCVEMSDGAELTACGTTITPLDQWVHLTGVLQNDGTVLLYKNGILDGSAQSSDIVGKTLRYQTHETAKIGAWGTLWGSDYLMDGLIDEVQIYNRALTPSEIRTIYEAGSAGVCSDGDCNDDGQVSIAEVQGAINMYLGLKPVDSCVDVDGNGAVSIAEVQKVINGYLGL